MRSSGGSLRRRCGVRPLPWSRSWSCRESSTVARYGHAAQHPQSKQGVTSIEVSFHFCVMVFFFSFFSYLSSKVHVPFS